MFADEVGAHRIPIPSNLKFVATKDSVAEFIDTIAIRDSDAIVPGFKVAVTHDLDLEGDWRGWALYADFGDGYQLLVEGDVAETLGTCTSTLGAVSDITVFDTVNSVTFTLDFDDEDGALFDNATDDELDANPYRNLFLIGDEYIQAGTITDNGNRSFTLTNLWRGRFETDQDVVHSASERVVYINGAEAFVEMSIDKVGIEFNYKFVTTNQNVTDAIAVPFTWIGSNVRPHKVTDITFVRDASNYWLIQCTMHPRPIELPAEGAVEIWEDHSRNDPNKKKRTLPLTEGTTHACLLDSSGDTVTEEDGTVVYYESTHTDKNNLVRS